MPGSYPITYPELLEMWREWALDKPNADSIMRRSGYKPGASAGDVPPTPILTLPGSKRVCFDAGTKFFPGEFNGFAVTPDGKLYGWGINNGNVFGQDTPTDYFYSPTRIGRGLSGPVSQAAAEEFGNLLLMDDGTLRVVSTDVNFAGDVAFDEEGGFRVYPDFTSGAQITASRWTSVGQQYVLKDDGTVWARGRRVPGISLEIGAATSDWSPDLTLFYQMPTDRIGEDVVEIRAGFAALAIRRDDGNILVWENASTMPVVLPTPPTGVVKMVFGTRVLTSAGEVWRANGVGATSWTLVDGSNYVDLAFGNSTDYMVKDDGTLWRRTGTATVAAFGTEFDDWVAVYGGGGAFAHNPVAVRENGCAYTWGDNSAGSAGVGYAGGTLADPVPLKVTVASPAWPV